jgi:uncharacterized repeat protein (TIGR03803 family)
MQMFEKRISFIVLLHATAAVTMNAQTFTTLDTFNGANGVQPSAGLVQAANGDLYGTTYEGGEYNFGTIFRISPDGALTVLYSFCAQLPDCPDGSHPVAPLVLATDGDLYGTTKYGGNSGCPDFYNCGTIFKITPNGTLTTIYTFCSQSECADGGNPDAGLVQATNGDLYGTTFFGGSNRYYTLVGGTVFKITPDGVFHELVQLLSAKRLLRWRLSRSRTHSGDRRASLRNNSGWRKVWRRYGLSNHPERYVYEAL